MLPHLVTVLTTRYTYVIYIIFNYTIGIRIPHWNFDRHRCTVTCFVVGRGIKDVTLTENTVAFDGTINAHGFLDGAGHGDR